MDKRLEANIRVKKNITDALFSLMKEKKLQDITVSEIVKKAGVARASYYRNFDSKESILYDFGYKLHNEYISNIRFDLNKSLTYSSILYTFKYYFKYKDFILELCRNDLSYMYLEMLNEFVEDAAGDMPANSIERYKIYCYTGAVFNMSIKWIEGGTKETPEEMAEEMAKAFLEFIK